MILPRARRGAHSGAKWTCRRGRAGGRARAARASRWPFGATASDDLTIQSSMVAGSPSMVRLEFTSAVEMLDLVHVVGHHLAHEVGLDEDAVHWVDVADPRIGHQRHHARQPERRQQARVRRVRRWNRRGRALPDDFGPRPGRRLRSRDRSPTRSTRKTSSSRAAAAFSSSGASWTTSSCSARRKAAWRFA